MISEKRVRELIETLASASETAYDDKRPDREAAYRHAVMMVQHAVVTSREDG